MSVPAVPGVGYQYCTGEVNVYAVPNASLGYFFVAPTPASALYLGTCEQYPIPSGQQFWEATYNDRGGPVPFDKQYFGEAKTIVMDLDKFSQSNLEVFTNFGIENGSVRGLFKNLNGLSFSLWLQFSLYGNPASISDLPPGEVYFNCTVAELTYDPIGTKKRKSHLTVEADPLYYVNSIVYGIPGPGFLTYSTDTSLFAGLPAAA